MKIFDSDRHTQAAMRGMALFHSQNSTQPLIFVGEKGYKEINKKGLPIIHIPFLCDYFPVNNFHRKNVVFKTLATKFLL